MSRQQRRAAERAATKAQNFDRVHGRVIAARSVLEMWRLYFGERFSAVNLPPDSEPILKEVFYAGAAAMLELCTRVAPDEVSEDAGVEMLQRIHDELRTYAGGLR